MTRCCNWSASTLKWSRHQKGAVLNPRSKVTVKVVGVNGSTLKLIEKVSRALDRGGHTALAKEYRGRVVKAQSFNEALQLSSEFVWIGGN